MHYYLYNAHGDVTGITDSSVNVVATYTYDEFGNLKSSTGTIYNPLRYSGANNAYYDSETGLYKMGVRYYNPEVGRWMTKDKFEGYKTESQTKNYYIYCGNNPITTIDKTGFSYARFTGTRFDGRGKLILRRRKYKNAFGRYYGPYKTIIYTNARTADPRIKGWKQKNGPTPPGTWWLSRRYIYRSNWVNGYRKIRLRPVFRGNRSYLNLHAGPWRPTYGCIRTSRWALNVFINELWYKDPVFPIYVKYTHRLFVPYRRKSLIKR